jgi:hypothetical protein
MSLSLAPLEIEKAQLSCDAPTVRTSTFEDYCGIVSLHERHGFGSKSYEEWRNLWVKNPFRNELTDWPMGWVLEDKNHRIVGYLGNIPLPYVFKHRRLVAATSKAWIVDFAFRSYSFLLLRRFFQQKNVDLFLNTTVNENAVRGYQAFRVSRVPIGAWDQSIFWITNYRGFAASFLRAKGIAAPTLLSLPVSLALRLQDKIKGKSHRSDQPFGPMIFRNSFDARFEAFWHRLQGKRWRVLLANRSRAILEWHFQRALAEKRAWLLTVDNGPELAAYAIFLRRDNGKYGLTRLRLIDFQSCQNLDELIVPMVLRALHRCRMEGIDMLEIIGLKPTHQHLLDHVVPRQRALPSWLYFYKTNDGQLARDLENPTSWDPSCFDGDASL